MDIKNTSVFTLRIKGDGLLPSTLPLDQMADYLSVFAKLVGSENNPIFTGLDAGSACLKASVPMDKEAQTEERLTRAANDKSFNAHKHYIKLEELLSKNNHLSAEFINAKKEVFFSVLPQLTTQKYTDRIEQETDVDGEIIGISQSKSIKEAIDIMIRNYNGQLFSFTTDLTVSFELNKYLLRGDFLRLKTQGFWLRIEDRGWIPENKKCKIISFEELNNADAHSIFNELLNTPNNRLGLMVDPEKSWREIRGIE